jgi:hypothetical protein
MAAFSLGRVVAPFSDQVIADDFPALPSARRRTVVEFVVRRIAGLPSPMRIGVTVVALFVGALGKVIGVSRLTRLLVRHPLPLLGDYVRLVRSLGYAYIWETWPSTGPDGRVLD